jgi:hypothetical protein
MFKIGMKIVCIGNGYSWSKKGDIATITGLPNTPEYDSQPFMDASCGMTIISETFGRGWERQKNWKPLNGYTNEEEIK